MATRHSPSRESSVSRPSLSQRPSLSRLSNPDVFSDDFALPSRGNSPDASPVVSTDSSSDDLPVHASSQPPPPQQSTVLPPSHLNTTNFSRPSSTSKRPLMFGEGQSVVPHRAVSSVSHSDAGLQRSSSASSHLSIPRAQSPYTGPTAPSHPYAMYPQMTRASSITSESTIRPAERPYEGTGGPEHPYGMYPQNTVEEEDDNEAQGPATIIPLGFPGMSQRYEGNQAAGQDLGDIVGHDGHIEQLPPYTRYADNTIAKGASDEHVQAPVAAVAVPLSPTASSQSDDSDVQVNIAAARDAGGPATEYNEKSRTRRRLRRKICWGVSLCVWLLVAGVIVIAGTLGGVIGGVIGNTRASDAIAEQSVPTATTTVWLDAAPLPTGVPPPTCTPGLYNMPTTNLSGADSSCISNPQYREAWECLDYDPIPFWISYLGSTPLIRLGWGASPGNGQSFNYGPQTPDLNGSTFPLHPSIDKDNPSAGGAMYVDVLFNKLAVVHQSVFSGPSKRSMKLADFEKRSNDPVAVSLTDSPYFCWFNQTLLELFIYSNLSTAASADNTTSYVYATSAATSSSPFSAAVSTSMSVQTSSGVNINQVTPPMTSTPPKPSNTDIYSSSWTTSTNYWPPSKRLARWEHGEYRDDDSYNGPPIYPKQVRLAEKRAPMGDDIKPYCVQMGINSDWSIFEIPGTNVEIKEIEPTTSSERRWNRPRDSKSSNNLDSDCACQWYST